MSTNLFRNDNGLLVFTGKTLPVRPSTTDPHAISVTMRIPEAFQGKNWLLLCTNTEYLCVREVSKEDAEVGERPSAIQCLEAYVKAQGRMLDRWSEAHSLEKKELWNALHACEADARECIERSKASGGTQTKEESGKP
jgi:hypothetical protein